MKFLLNPNKKESNMNKIKMFSLTACFMLAMAFTLSCSSGGGGDDNTYYISLYGISEVTTCQYLDEMLLGLGGGSMTEDDWEGKGYFFADVKGAWDQYRLSGTGVMLSSQGGYTEDVLRAKMTQGGLTTSELNAYMRGLNQRGNNLTMLLPSEIVAFYNSNNSSCYAVLYVEKE
jgi:hypothetical protein